MTDKDLYKDITEMFLTRCKLGMRSRDPQVLQNNWLYGMEAMQNDEGERIIALLPIIKFEIEHKILSAELEEELIIYHEDFEKGIFKKYINPEEYNMVEADLNWCFDNYQGAQYKEP